MRRAHVRKGRPCARFQSTGHTRPRIGCPSVVRWPLQTSVDCAMPLLFAATDRWPLPLAGPAPVGCQFVVPQRRRLLLPRRALVFRPAVSGKDQRNIARQQSAYSKSHYCLAGNGESRSCRHTERCPNLELAGELMSPKRGLLFGQLSQGRSPREQR